MRAKEGDKPDKRRYKTTNWREYNKALKARGSLTVWLDKDMQWFATSTGKRGRHPTFSDAAIQFCLSIKCLLGLALRQALGFVHSLLCLAGLEWSVPDYSTLSRRQQTLHVQLPYKPSATALDLLVDSTGIKFLGEGEWKRKKRRCETRPLTLANDWAHAFGRSGVATTDAVWWRPRCIASNGWARG